MQFVEMNHELTMEMVQIHHIWYHKQIMNKKHAWKSQEKWIPNQITNGTVTNNYAKREYRDARLVY